MKRKLLDGLFVVAAVVSIVSGLGWIIDNLKSLNAPFRFDLAFVLSTAILVVAVIAIWRKRKSEIEYQDRNAIYSVEYVNEAGDAIIVRTISVVCMRDLLSRREHGIYSDGAPMASNEMELRAWDGDGDELATEFVLDEPTRKQFIVHFKEPLRKGSKVEYSYRYMWLKLLSLPHDYFDLLDTSLEPEFHLSVLRGWHIRYVKAEEVFRDGHANELVVKKLGKDLDGDLEKHRYTLRKNSRQSMIKLSWDVAQRT